MRTWPFTQALGHMLKQMRETRDTAWDVWVPTCQVKHRISLEGNHTDKSLRLWWSDLTCGPLHFKAPMFATNIAFTMKIQCNGWSELWTNQQSYIYIVHACMHIARWTRVPRVDGRVCSCSLRSFVAWPPAQSQATQMVPSTRLVEASKHTAAASPQHHRTSGFLGLTAFLMLLLSFVSFYTLDYSGLSASAGCSVWSGVWNSFLIAIASVVTACSFRFLSYGLFSLVSNFMSPWVFSILFCPSSD